MRLAAIMVPIALLGCAGDEGSPPPFASDLPAHFPTPRDSTQNPSSPDAIELGRHLFYDNRLSGNASISCADCHRPEFAFADNRALSLGDTGEAGTLNAPSLANLVYMRPLGWAKPSLQHVEEQLLGPMFGETPIEMGITGREDEVIDRLRGDMLYLDLFRQAYPAESAPSLAQAQLALASFTRSILSYQSPFDRFIAGEREAISEAAERGAELFYSSRLGCGDCHSGFNFTTAVVADTETEAFHNIGLYNIDGAGGYPDAAPGLINDSGIARDMGRFRVPSLRNVALTAPYMHDGSVATLREVIEIYEDGGRTISDGPNAGDGRTNPFRSDRLVEFSLSENERADLLAFLQSLSDAELGRLPQYQSPW